MDELARPAQLGDLPALGRLLEAAGRELAGRRGARLFVSGAGAGPPARGAGADVDELLAAWMAEPPRCVLAGTLDDVVVGLASGHVEPPVRGVGPIGVVDCCYVEEAARQVGVGGALRTALQAWFDRQGCDGVDVPVLPGDRASKQLWEAAGFSARLLVLHRPPG